MLHSLEKLRGTAAWLDGHDSANSMGATAPLHKTPGTSVAGAEHKARCTHVDSWAEVRKCVATHPIAVPYSEYTVQILPGDTYFIDSRGAVVVGFRGSYVRFAAFFVHHRLSFSSDSLLSASKFTAFVRPIHCFLCLIRNSFFFDSPLAIPDSLLVGSGLLPGSPHSRLIVFIRFAASFIQVHTFCSSDSLLSLSPNTPLCASNTLLSSFKFAPFCIRSATLSSSLLGFDRLVRFLVLIGWFASWF
jgi:hypothetical protein